jgi:uncharacterized protein (DUF305 family)
MGRKRVAVLIPAASLLLLSACVPDTDHNAADVRFAQQMVPHHQQALRMAHIVAGSKAGAEVERLAAEIEKDQGPEIGTMNGWLDDWHAKAGSTHGSLEHASGGGDEGMISREQMDDLDDAWGQAFDRLWLTLMIEHHEGAVTLAEREMRDGEYSEAIDLAHEIATGQAAEIDHMKEMLDD